MKSIGHVILTLRAYILTVLLFSRCIKSFTSFFLHPTGVSILKQVGTGMMAKRDRQNTRTKTQRENRIFQKSYLKMPSLLCLFLFPFVPNLPTLPPGLYLSYSQLSVTKICTASITSPPLSHYNQTPKKFPSHVLIDPDLSMMLRHRI